MVFKKIKEHKHFFQNTIQKISKMVLHISKKVEDVDKTEEKKEKKAETASTSQPVDCMKQTGDGEKNDFLPVLDEKKKRYRDHQ